MVCPFILFQFPISHGYTQFPSIHSLFLKFASQSSMTTLLIDVDDTILTANNIIEIVHIAEELDKAFQNKDLGDLKFFLDFEGSHQLIQVGTSISIQDTPFEFPSPYTTKRTMKHNLSWCLLIR